LAGWCCAASFPAASAFLATAARTWGGMLAGLEYASSRSWGTPAISRPRPSGRRTQETPRSRLSEASMVAVPTAWAAAVSASSRAAALDRCRAWRRSLAARCRELMRCSYPGVYADTTCDADQCQASLVCGVCVWGLEVAGPGGAGCAFAGGAVAGGFAGGAGVAGAGGVGAAAVVVDGRVGVFPGEPVRGGVDAFAVLRWRVQAGVGGIAVFAALHGDRVECGQFLVQVEKAGGSLAGWLAGERAFGAAAGDPHQEREGAVQVEGVHLPGVHAPGVGGLVGSDVLGHGVGHHAVKRVAANAADLIIGAGEEQPGAPVVPPVLCRWRDQVVGPGEPHQDAAGGVAAGAGGGDPGRPAR